MAFSNSCYSSYYKTCNCIIFTRLLIRNHYKIQTSKQIRRLNLKWRGVCLTLLFSLLLCYVVSAQETVPEQPLFDVLAEIQGRFEHKFNYASETIDGVSLVPPSTDLSFDETVRYLQQATGLIFTVLDSAFVSIKRPDIELCGYLRDKDTQEPIINASVQAGKSATITDEAGYFILKLSNETEMINIRHLSYKALDRAYPFFKKDSCGDIYLVPQQQELAEIVISDYLVRGIDKLNNGTYTIDVERFGLLPGLIEADVLQSVQAFPGILSINETVSNLNIRGGTHDQNLILWDGIKMYQSGHFFGMISMYNPQITQKVVLRKNGTDVSLTDGVSGTIAMETEKQLNTKFQGNIGVNFIDANGFADVPVGRHSSLQISARKSNNSFVETPTYRKYFERIAQDTEVESNTTNIINSDIEFDFYDQSLRWLFHPSEKDELQLNFINVTNKLVFNENAMFNNIEDSRQSSLSQNSIAGGFQYRRSWTDRFQTSLHIYETDYKLKAVNSNILDDQSFTQENKVSETGLKLETSYAIRENWQLLSGYQYVDTKVTNTDQIDKPAFLSLNGEVVRTHGLFSQLNIASKDRWTNLNFGVRYNYIPKFRKTVWEPRLSFNQRFLNTFNLEILGEFKHQNTSQIINFQNDFLGIEKRRWQLSDDAEIPVIISKQLSAGLSYTQGEWLVNAVGYIKKVDGITSQSQGFQNQYEFVKATGSYDAMGMDLLLRKRINNISTWLSYSYLDSSYTFETLPEKTFASNLDITHAISFGTSYTPEHLKLSAGLNWRTGKPTTRPIPDNQVLADNVNYGLANDVRLDDYMRIDISAIYQFGLGNGVKLDMGVSVWNVLDKENTINNFYRVSPLGIPEEVTQNSLGITPNVLVRLYF